MKMRQETQLVTLFADVAGSTALYQRHGDRVALSAIDGCLQLAKDVTAEFSGRSVKTIGDELMAVFADPEDCFRAACEMQWRVGELPAVGGDQLAIRVGFHFGYALEQGGDVFGDSVNIAARLVGLAKPGQILTSGRTVDAGGMALSSCVRRLGHHTLRGTQSEEAVLEVMWQDSDEVTALISHTLPQGLPAGHLVLRYAEQELIVGPQRPSILLGRGVTNDLVLSSVKASRVHAQIQWRREKFILQDQSTNGTYVLDEQGRETMLRLEEMALYGHGRISFGTPATSATEALLEFSCEDGGTLALTQVRAATSVSSS